MATREDIKRTAVILCEDFGLDWDEATYLVDYLFTFLNDAGVVIRKKKSVVYNEAEQDIEWTRDYETLVEE